MNAFISNLRLKLATLEQNIANDISADASKARAAITAEIKAEADALHAHANALVASVAGDVASGVAKVEGAAANVDQASAANTEQKTQ